MANGVLIVGPSGSGKSTGVRNLDPTSTFIINSDRKSLPIQGWKTKYQTLKDKDGKTDLDKSNYLETDDPANIIKLLDYISKSRPDIKVIIIDTINHVMTSEFIKNIAVTGYDKFNRLAANIYYICKASKTMRDDLTVFVLAHNEVAYDADGIRVNKVKTVGKMLDDKIDLPSMFTTVLYTAVDPKDKTNPYGFTTQTDGTNNAKSPFGMFDTTRIANDYALVCERINEYEN